MFIELLFPPTCVICGETVAKGEVLCAKCEVDWEMAKEKQRVSGGGVPVRSYNPTYGERAGNCVFLTGYFQNDKHGAVARMIYRLKSKGDTSVVNFAAKQLAYQIRECIPEQLLKRCVLTYIPRGNKNAAYYGFDHMHRVSRSLAEELNIPMRRMLKRVGFSRTQKNLDRALRKENAVRSIAARPQKVPVDAAILMIDDIITTGASMDAAATVLLDCGALEVYAFTLAATKSRESEELLVQEQF